MEKNIEMKRIINKIFEPSIIGAVWLMIGMFVGYYFSINVINEIVMNSKNSYDKGFNDASENCQKMFKINLQKK